MFSLRRAVTRAIAKSPSSSPSSAILKAQSQIQIQCQTQLLTRSYSIALARSLLSPATYSSSFSSSSSTVYSLSPSSQRRWISDEQQQQQQQPEEEEVWDEGAVSEGAAASEANPREIFIGGMFYDISEDMMRERFSEFGKVTYAKIMHDRRGMSQGYGWVHFADPASAQSAIEEMDQRIWEGRMVTVRPATARAKRREPAPGMAPPTASSLYRRPPNPPSKTLFIGNLSYDMTDVDLNNLFRPIKNVIDVRVAIDRRTGQPRGFAHADFLDVESAVRAAEQLRSQKIYGRQLRIDYGLTYVERPGEPTKRAEPSQQGDMQ